MRENGFSVSVRPGCLTEKKRTRQAVKKVTSGDILLIWGEAPTVPIKTKIYLVV